MVSQEDWLNVDLGPEVDEADQLIQTYYAENCGG